MEKTVAAKEGHIERSNSFLPGSLFRLFFFWPFALLWKFVTFTCNAIGIMMCLLLGSALLVGGYFLTATVIGAIIGIPMLVFGLFLVARAIY
jgi:hypothetical protein